MGRLRAKSDYENLRNARISENQARLASLGLEKTASDLHSIISSTKPIKTPIRKNQKAIYDRTCLRRSDRLKGKLADPKLILTDKIGLSERTRPMPRRLFNRGDDEEEMRPANAPFLSIHPSELQLPPDVLARRCDSKSRGSVYNSILGICCHFCRQKKLCGEEDCKRCGNGDINQPCIGKTDCSACHSSNGILCRACLKVRYGEGKIPSITAPLGLLDETDCSVCHSSNGILCRACLKVRYGEEMEKVRNNKKWMCPHCIEDQGLKPFWICNSSICLKKRKIAPTGIAIFEEAREKGFKSVAHLLMDKLKQAEGRQSQS